MLIINVPSSEYYDPVSEEFVNYPAQILKLEHSLVAISKWESKWLKPFLATGEKTSDEIYYYISCMLVEDSEVGDRTIRALSQNNLDIITEYIKAPMTATTITQTNSKGSKEIVTSELIYYWMISFNIPFECQHWHLNRLLMLISICNVKNTPPKKMKSGEILAKNRDLNAARKKALKTSG